MNSVYTSKAQYDAKCEEAKEATETMEQHLYAFLGKRYGLKSVIQVWASAIFTGIQKFATKESEVAIFGKILQNTVAESFPSVADTCRQTVQQLLRAQLEERHPNRSQAEIEALWRARSRSGIPLAECAEVVKYMYNDSDNQELMTRLSYTSQNASTAEGAEPLTPGCVRMKDVMQVLLSFQMGLTEGFLADFVQIFKQVDTDQDGIVNFTQLDELVRRVGYVENVEDNSPSGTVLMEAKSTTYTAVRRYRKGATFSQCVDLFTGLISARWGAVEAS
jgi:hypothetical protein